MSSRDRRSKRPRHLSRLFWPVPFPDQWGWGKQSQGINEYRTNPEDGIDLGGSFFELPESQFRFTLDLNLMGTVLPTQILGPQILKQERGAILNISSMNAYRPLTKIPAYSAGKCGKFH